MLTWRRTPIPAKIAFEGGNICSYTHQRINLEWLNVWQLPAQLHFLGSQRMRTRHLQWDPATLSMYLHFGFDRTPGPGLEEGPEWHWKSCRTVAEQLKDGR